MSLKELDKLIDKAEKYKKNNNLEKVYTNVLNGKIVKPYILIRKKSVEKK